VVWNCVKSHSKYGSVAGTRKHDHEIIKVFYSPTDAQVNCLKNNFKIYIKIDNKTAVLM
jgi:hypothetical protein